MQLRVQGLNKGLLKGWGEPRDAKHNGMVAGDDTCVGYHQKRVRVSDVVLGVAMGVSIVLCVRHVALGHSLSLGLTYILRHMTVARWATNAATYRAMRAACVALKARRIVGF